MAKMLTFQPAKRLLQNAYQRGPVQVYVSFIIFVYCRRGKQTDCAIFKIQHFRLFFQQKY